AERFIFIRDGRLIHDITKAELEEKSKKYLLLQVDNVPEAVRLLETYFKAIQYTVLPNQVIQIHNYMEEAHQINKVLVEHHILIKEFRIDQKELETYFLELEEAESNV
ncbi:ABC transporter ATP-binding protein, partial [Staphylococcus felis]